MILLGGEGLEAKSAGSWNIARSRVGSSSFSVPLWGEDDREVEGI